MSREAFICTKERPWTIDDPLPAQHPDASEVGDQEDGWPSGDIVRFQCPHCGVKWKQELPQ